MQPCYSMSLSYVRQMRPPCLSESASLKGCSTEMVRFSGGFPLSRRTVRFEDEKSESSSEVSTTVFSCMNSVEDVSNDISSLFDKNPPPKQEPQTQGLILFNSQLKSQHPLPWTTRAKNCLCLGYHVFSWLARYLLLGYLFLSLAGIGSEPSTDGQGNIGLFDLNNIISDLLPTPIAGLQRCFGPLQQLAVQEIITTERSAQHTEDTAIDKWADTTEVTPTSAEQSKPAPTSTEAAYIDWIDRALGWKGLREQ